MKAKFSLLILGLILTLCLLLSSCGEAELPYVGENGNWFINGEDTGVAADGRKGETGDKGETGESGKDGAKGEVGDTLSGDMPTVVGVEKISSEGAVTTYKITFSDGYTAEMTVTDGADGEDGEADVVISDLVYSKTLTPSSAAVADEALASGERLVIPKEKYNLISSSRVICFTCKLSELGDGKIYIGQGKDELGASYVEISKDTLTVYTKTSSDAEAYYVDARHRLKIKDTLSVSISVSYGQAEVSVFSSDGLYTKSNAMWCGSAGELFAEAEGVSLSNVSLRTGSGGYAEGIWLMCDATPSEALLENWIYLLGARGYHSNMLIGTPNISSTLALSEFNKALEKGTPVYAVWAVGANESDAGGTVNATYLANTEAFLAKCEEKGIIPILATLPNTAAVDNSAKNAYVAASGERYVDFAAAFGASAAGDTEWNAALYETVDGESVVSSGAVARAAFSAIVSAVPELMLDK